MDAGIASHDAFLHRVYCEAARRHLHSLGLTATFEPVRVSVAPGTWEGAEAGRNWWALEHYSLPVCVRRRREKGGAPPCTDGCTM